MIDSYQLVVELFPNSQSTSMSYVKSSSDSWSSTGSVSSSEVSDDSSGRSSSSSADGERDARCFLAFPLVSFPSFPFLFFSQSKTCWGRSAGSPLSDFFLGLDWMVAWDRDCPNFRIDTCLSFSHGSCFFGSKSKSKKSAGHTFISSD